MNKTILLIIALFVSVESFATNRLSIEKRNVAINDTARIYIRMENDIKINGLNFIIEFDPSVITPVNFRPVGRASALSDAEAFCYTEDKISFILYDEDAKQIDATADSIFELTYIVKDSVTIGTSTQLEFYQGLVADEKLIEVPFEYFNGEITITGIKESRPPELPTQFMLFQNFPNPFNPNTVIKYGLPITSKVTLKIYNILGQEVRTLVDAVQEAGYKTVQWTARNNSDNYVATGVYFYRIEATGLGRKNASFVKIKQMTLIK